MCSEVNCTIYDYDLYIHSRHAYVTLLVTISVYICIYLQLCASRGNTGLFVITNIVTYTVHYCTKGFPKIPYDLS